MIDHDTLTEVLALGEKRRAERRQFLQSAASAGLAVGGASLLAACNTDGPGSQIYTVTPTPVPASTTAQVDVDVLNFALNLEYLEANFYSYAATGAPVSATFTAGTGTQGAVTGGRQVAFADASVAAYAREIAADELQHVQFLRSALGTAAVAQPALNIDGSATGAFTAAARAAGIVSSTGTFDPYASDDNFLLAAFLFEDVGVTAYKGAATLISSKTILEAAAGILAVEAYHAGLVRTLLYRRGVNTPTDRSYSEAISNARDSLDGASDDDQGVAPVTINGGTASNIVPTDANGIAYGRTAANVLNVVYLTRTATTSGGFFPAGVNGNIRTSGAN